MAARWALAVVLSALSKASFGFLGKLFRVSRTTAYHWIRAEAERPFLKADPPQTKLPAFPFPP